MSPPPPGSPAAPAAARPASARRAAAAKTGENARKIRETGSSYAPSTGSNTDPRRSRLARLAALLPGAGVDRLLVTNPKDVGYLTGFLNGDSYLVVGPKAGSTPGAQGGGGGGATVISDFRFEEELLPIKQAGLADIFIRKGSITDAVVEVLAGAARSERIGVQAEHLTVALRAAIAKGLGAARVVDTAGLVASLRLVKDDDEVRTIAKAAKLQEAALQAVLPTLKPGLTELEVAAAIEAEMKSRGSSEPGFQTIVAAAAHGSLPHYRPGKAKLAKNQPVLIDWGAVLNGYHSDMTRVFTLGKWPTKVREIYDIVLEAQEMAAAALAPGKTTQSIDAVARDFITSRGYGPRFGHGLGHGLGLDGHEEPRLTHMLAPTVLKAGMVVTVEPGIYLPGVGGVRIEDDYVITPTGARNLCSMPKDPEWACL